MLSPLGATGEIFILSPIRWPGRMYSLLISEDVEERRKGERGGREEGKKGGRVTDC